MASNPPRAQRLLRSLAATTLLAPNACNLVNPNPPPTLNSSAAAPRSTSTASAQNSQQAPVWILPELRTADVLPSGDHTSWQSGYQTASIITPGRWATRAEADALHAPYINPHGHNEIIPVPPAPIPTQRPTPLPPSHPAPAAKSAPLAPLATLAKSATIEQSDSLPPPRIAFALASNELVIHPSPARSGTFSVPTPLGPAVLRYDAGLINVRFARQTVAIPQPSPESAPVRVRLAE